MNNATSCNVCVFESRNKWEMAACFVVLSSSSWVIPTHCMTSSRTFSPQNETCDTYKNLLQECIPLYYSQTHTHLKYWGAIQSNLCVYFGRPSNVEISWNIKWFSCCCFLTVTKFCTYKLFWRFISFELRHPLYINWSWKQKRFNFQHKFQHSTACPNDMIHVLAKNSDWLKTNFTKRRQFKTSKIPWKWVFLE